MNFTIKSIILWPKDDTKEIRVIDFAPDKVNVITGGSEKGKSSIIAIIDYCLGSSICRIPTSTIRDLTEWFGIIVSLEDNQEILLARLEPGLEKASGAMYMKTDTSIVIPEKLTTNCNFEDVKHRLNIISNLPYSSFEPGQKDSGFQGRPSFRDMVSFVFQPQYIVANQSSLFYKSDSSKHREKIKTIFPYILNAVNNEYLELKEELKEKEKELSGLERELEKRKKVSEKWLGEIRANYLKAKEYGLLDNAPYPSDDWKPEEYVSYLRVIPQKNANNEIPLVPIGATSKTTERITKLQEDEIELAYDIQKLRTREELIKKIESSNKAYRETLLEQYSRLNSINWFNKNLGEKTTCPFCESETTKAKEYITSLINTNNLILEKGNKNNDQKTVLIGELNKLGSQLREKEKSLNIIRNELKNLQSLDVINDNRIQTINAIYKYIGQLEAELRNYDLQLDNSELTDQLIVIRERIDVISGKIKEDVVANKLKNAKVKIIESLKFYAKIFNAANHDKNIDLNTRDLTLNFTSDNGRIEALYEIGSGSNYMAFHLSLMLALHEYFLKQNNHPVPSFIVFDQPSQAYFPDNDVEGSEKDEDVKRVKRIFEALSKAIERTNGKLQIIILEHVGRYAWDNYENINLVKRWREDENDNALIPRGWIK